MAHSGRGYEEMSVEEVRQEIYKLQAVINCYKRSKDCWHHIQRLRDLHLVLEMVHDEYL